MMLVRQYLCVCVLGLQEMSTYFELVQPRRWSQGLVPDCVMEERCNLASSAQSILTCSSREILETRQIHSG